MEQEYKNLKEHYQFTQEDSDILLGLKSRMEELAEDFIDGFYDYIWGFGATATFLKNKEIIAYHREKIKEWFINLFCGRYDMPYFMNLYKIGEIHVRIGLPTHYVNAAFTYVLL
ncbi:protoglobin domain-containing protein [Sulfuricurvum sp.]|uniref:protoglobin domain-containing protein n=1 Tax=Sulfuricurvum sp. TaxID=2025608 RepID=UPI0025FA21DE|nr:protoglobin domain-containing protein [Sulfuricurvum sp.]